jgi:hypothetical protein
VSKRLDSALDSNSKAHQEQQTGLRNSVPEFVHIDFPTEEDEGFLKLARMRGK